MDLGRLLSGYVSPNRAALEPLDPAAMLRQKRLDAAQNPFKAPPIPDPLLKPTGEAIGEGAALHLGDAGVPKDTAQKLGSVFSTAVNLVPPVQAATTLTDAASAQPMSMWDATTAAVDMVGGKLEKAKDALTSLNQAATPQPLPQPPPQQLPLPLPKPYPIAFDRKTALDFTRSGAEPEPGYLYHATNTDRAGGIASAGYVDVFPPDYGTEQSMWPDTSTENRSYWTAKGGPTAASFVPAGGSPVLLRTKQTDAFRQERGTGDYYTTGQVQGPEYLTANGWRRLGGNAPVPPLAETMAKAVAQPYKKYSKFDDDYDEDPQDLEEFISGLQREVTNGRYEYNDRARTQLVRDALAESHDGAFRAMKGDPDAIESFVKALNGGFGLDGDMSDEAMDGFDYIERSLAKLR